MMNWEQCGKNITLTSFDVLSHHLSRGAEERLERYPEKKVDIPEDEPGTSQMQDEIHQ